MPMRSLAEIVAAAKDHLHGDDSKGLVENLSDRISRSDQKRIEQPGDPELELNAVFSSGPEVIKTEKTLDNRVSIFNR